MSATYISIEKNIDVFEYYKRLWADRGITGIRADTMTVGIEKAIEIEKSKINELYFIDIAADDIDFMPQLRILSEETNAPILIATSQYTEDEHHEALNNGADFYGKYCDDPEKNINAVIAAVNSIDRRARKRKAPNKIITDGKILILSLSRRVFVSDKEIKLVNKEFELLRYFVANKGNFLSHAQLLRKAWGEEYNDNGTELLWRTIERLRSKLSEISPDQEYIKMERNIGYKFMS
jgi:DNA-binding response OmpR family regulator